MLKSAGFFFSGPQRRDLRVRYAKAPHATEELVGHLVGLGLEGDRDTIGRRLRDVGYYRLSPYWRFYRKDPRALGGRLVPGTSIDQVWSLYTFDRELRLLALDAIERVEIGVRARLVQNHVRAHGPFGYASEPPDDHRGRYTSLIGELQESLCQARENPDAPWVSEAMRHFASKYGDSHEHPPLWLAAEGFSFGDLVTLYRRSPTQVRKATAMEFDVPDAVFVSWLLMLQTVRNICAHHGRLWNRTIGTKPKVPHDRPEWADPSLGPTHRVFFTFTILAAFVAQLSDGSRWGERFRTLVEERYPDVPHDEMGLRAGWKDHPIWVDRLR